MNTERAIQVLEIVAQLAQKAGALSLEDAVNATFAISTLRKTLVAPKAEEPEKVIE